MFEDSVTYQYIGNVTNGATTEVTTASGIASGSVALVNEAGVVYEDNQTASTAKWRIANKLSTGKIVYSPFFVPSAVTITSASYSAPVEQVSTWGYNGTDGSLGAITSGNVYSLSVVLQHTATMINSYPFIKTIPYKATAATQYNVANGLDIIFDKIMSKWPGGSPIKVELLNSGTSIATSGGAFTVVNGSTTVTTVESAGAAADAAKYDTDGATIVAGDIIRFGHATTKTYPVYKVVSISGTTAAKTIVLDRPYKGTSGTVAANATGVIAVISEGDYGLKFTGLDRFRNLTFNPVTDTYSKVKFAVTSEDFDSTVTFRTATDPSEGIGSYYEVAQREVYCAMNEYAGRFLSAYPPTKYRGEALSTEAYDIIVIEGTNEEAVFVGTGIKPVSKFRIILALEDSMTGDDVDTALNVTV